MRNSKNLLIATGITGGHFYPAISFARAYLENHPDVHIDVLLPKKETAFPLDSYKNLFQFHHISIQAFPRSLSMSMLLYPWLFLQAFVKTFSFIKKKRPFAVVSFGSYGSIPAVIAAWLMRIPVVVHEQNRIFGWANLASSFFAKVVAISFPETLGFAPRHKITCTGYPIRQEILNAVKQEAFDGKSYNPFRILVLGGSQGSRAINQLIFDFISCLNPAEKARITILHVTGQKDFKMVSEQCRVFNLEYQAFPFHDDIKQLFSIAHFVIARAGAGTIFEMAAFGLPGFFIPYPYAYSHQFKNAQYVASLGGAWVESEETVTGVKIKETIWRVLDDAELYQSMASKVRKLHQVNADKNIVGLVDGCLKRQ